jgi:hypothetical protein
MSGLRRNLDLSSAFEIAVDLLLLHQSFNGVDGGIIGVVERCREPNAESARNGVEILRQAVVAMTAVAAGCLSADDVRFDHDDVRALLRERKSRRETGKASTYYRNIALALHRTFGGAFEATG